MSITKNVIIVFLTTILLFNQIIIVLEKEKLEKRLKIILKIISGNPLTRKEKKYARKLKW